MHAPLELDLHLAQFRLHALAHRLPQHRKPSIAPLPSADVRKAEEVEGLALPFSTLLPVFSREAAKLQPTRLATKANFRKRSVRSAQNRSASDGQLLRTRGRCGSLTLQRMTLSSTTPCRF
jgi:hypothetical protein